MDNKEFYKRQISLSEWFDSFENFDKESFRIEDNEKRERLRLLNDVINLPFDKPTQFKAIDITNNSSEFQKFFSKHKSELCALRLIPTEPQLPKLRLRGVSVEEVLKWYKEQEIDPQKYKADFIPHSENALWSTIFVVNKNGIFGEIIFGMHNQLTQGFYDSNKPILFSFDYKKIALSEDNKNAQKHVEEIIKRLEVKSSEKRKVLSKELRATFSKNYLDGYFETISTKEFGLWFIDYNRILGEKYKDYIVNLKTDSQAHTKSLKGVSASQGIAKGVVRILSSENFEGFKINPGEILVTEMTTPDHVIFMKNASAVITDKGGILSHAAIVAREFGIPCIVATKTATITLKEGDSIEVNATTGLISIL